MKKSDVEEVDHGQNGGSSEQTKAKHLDRSQVRNSIV